MRAGHIRLRPILMTTLTTVLGLVADGARHRRGRGAARAARDHRRVRAHGRTLLTLVVIPAVYLVVPSRVEAESSAPASAPAASPRPRPNRHEALRERGHVAARVLHHAARSRSDRCSSGVGRCSCWARSRSSRLPLAFLPGVRGAAALRPRPVPDATPDQIERTIVRPLEEALGSVKGLRHMWSHVRRPTAGACSISFDWSREHEARARRGAREDGPHPARAAGRHRTTSTISSGLGRARTGRADHRGRGSLRGHDLSRELRAARAQDRRSRSSAFPASRRCASTASTRRKCASTCGSPTRSAHGVDVRDLVAHPARRNNFDRSLGMIRGDERATALRTVGDASQRRGDRGAAARRGLRLARRRRRRLRRAAARVRAPPRRPVRDRRHRQQGSPSAQHGRDLRRGEAPHRRDGDDPELEGINFLVWEDQGEEIRKTLSDLANTGIFGAHPGVARAVRLPAALQHDARGGGRAFRSRSSSTCGVIWARGGRSTRSRSSGSSSASACWSTTPSW